MELLNILLGVGAVAFCILVAVMVLIIVAQWMCFKKAGEPGWAALIPFYNQFVLVKIALGNATMFWVQQVIAIALNIVNHSLITSILSLANLAVTLYVHYNLMRSFDYKQTASILGAIFPFVGIPMVAFSKAEYMGPVINNM